MHVDELFRQAEIAGALLKDRKETIAISESSTGGLISAALLAVPGASAYFLGGAVVYTVTARRELLGIPDQAMRGMRSASEAYAQLAARTVREKFGTTWSIAETGATGPSGNRYGDAAGHCCIAISGPRDVVTTLETGSTDRTGNMQQFGVRAIELLIETLKK
jgi:nicotinamide-nucleotide amidase